MKKLGLDLILLSHRLISNLPFLSKVLEQCVLKQFNNYYRTVDLMTDYQSTYHVNYRTVTLPW